MHIAQNWRLNAQRYALIGEKCPHCGKCIFPPRDKCPYCAVEVNKELKKETRPESFDLARRR